MCVRVCMQAPLLHLFCFLQVISLIFLHLLTFARYLSPKKLSSIHVRTCVCCSDMCAPDHILFFFFSFSFFQNHPFYFLDFYLFIYWRYFPTVTKNSHTKQNNNRKRPVVTKSLSLSVCQHDGSAYTVARARLACLPNVWLFCDAAVSVKQYWRLLLCLCLCGLALHLHWTKSGFFVCMFVCLFCLFVFAHSLHVSENDTWAKPVNNFSTRFKGRFCKIYACVHKRVCFCHVSVKTENLRAHRAFVCEGRGEREGEKGSKSAGVSVTFTWKRFTNLFQWKHLKYPNPIRFLLPTSFSKPRPFPPISCARQRRTKLFDTSSPVHVTDSPQNADKVCQFAVLAMRLYESLDMKSWSLVQNTGQNVAVWWGKYFVCPGWERA